MLCFCFETSFGESVFLFYIGYVRITDFGIARVLKPENYQDTSGTPGYMGKNNFNCFN